MTTEQATGEYTWNPARGGFTHTHDRDLQVIVVWETGRDREQEILALVDARFTILAQYEVSWPQHAVVNSFERLYGRPLTGRFGKPAQVGTGPFLVLVVEDRTPLYGYLPNVSGLVEPTNLAMAEVKQAARELTGGYRVHSSNNLTEFFRDATLILGPERLDELMTGPRSTSLWQFIDSAPDGTDGWDDLQHLFRALRRSTEYVVLRNFEQLPWALDDDDEIDILCRDPLELAGVANAVKEGPPTVGARYACTVAGRTVHLDVRYIGDGYLDTRWQERILRRRVWHDDVAVPAKDDHFFSLLYHAKIQKPAVKPAYRPVLYRLAGDIGLGDHTDITADHTAAALLDGFLAAHDYGIPLPADRGVHRNHAFLSTLTLTTPQPSPVRAARDDLWRWTRRGPIGGALSRVTPLRAAYRLARTVLAR